MSIDFIRLNCFRNFESYEFSPSSNLTLIHGANASGKTSLLESIYYLSRTRSFRTSNSNKLIQEGKDSMSVFAKVNSNGRQIPIGIHKAGNKQSLKINSENVIRASEMTDILPLQIIHPESHRLIEGGPVFRRHYMDWGVFHVEPEFYDTWIQYRQVLKQRNAALRDSRFKGSLSFWDHELVKYGELIDGFRRSYISKIQAFVPSYLVQLIGAGDYQFEYRSGWPEKFSLSEAIIESKYVDQSRGFTTVGPHRADLKIQLNGQAIGDRISRGQQKILVSTLLLAQTILFENLTQRVCILLIDDIAAELDTEHREAFIDVLSKFKLQLFISSISVGSEWDSYTKDKVEIKL